MHNKEDFFQKVLEYAKEKGFTDSEIYFVKSKDFDVMSFNQTIEKFSSSETIGISFRGLYNDKMGYSYTEIMDEKSVQMLVDEAMKNVTSIDAADKEFLHDGSGNYAEFSGYRGEIEEISPDEKIQIALDIEKGLLDKDKVFQTNYCTYGESYSEVEITNTRGLKKHKKNDVAFIYGMAVANEQNNPDISPKTGFGKKVIKGKNDIDIEYVVNEAYENAVSMLGAKSIKSGEYCIVLKNEAVNDFLSAFASVFSAENVQKGRSLLKDKLDKQIANPALTIYDDPFITNSVTSCDFDGEGVPTYKKELIANGVLKTYLHNLKTAAKDGVETTGNAKRSGHRSRVGIAPINVVIRKGELDLDGLIKKCGKGLYITQISGLHAGTNAISGDFSIMSEGYEISDGKIGRPIDQITISGNLFTFFNNIEEIGNDVKSSMPSYGTYHSPSLLVKGIAVAGA